MTRFQAQSLVNLAEGSPAGLGVLDAVRSVLARLPSEQREIVVLLGYYRLTRDEIGALLDQPVARVDALFRAAIRSLKRILGSVPQLGFA